jgi:hypothetical protein
LAGPSALGLGAGDDRLRLLFGLVLLAAILGEQGLSLETARLVELGIGAVLTFCLRLIASHITKLFWPLQQGAFPAFPFFKCCRAIGVPVDDLISQIGCLALGFELSGVARALGAHAFNGPAFIFPTLSGPLAWVMCALWALGYHAASMPPFAAAG